MTNPANSRNWPTYRNIEELLAELDLDSTDMAAAVQTTNDYVKTRRVHAADGHR
ncbi:hypothetical protein [Nocardia lasii]|uniref:Uncharacterized protein n=1 Tax=Nocardia lasii TaxID=1616107 RepID=A0ABW1JWR9_9NOCA